MKKKACVQKNKKIKYQYKNVKILNKNMKYAESYVIGDHHIYNIKQLKSIHIKEQH